MISTRIESKYFALLSMAWQLHSVTLALCLELQLKYRFCIHDVLAVC